ncbi:MAG TPA: ABC transporter permease [Cyclobacteriaceae bacterium]|nr:ABC transporter permease [Cyclobacteriaceae bacterium]
MLRSFLVITLRLLWRNKLISLINIFSLAIGIMAFILIMLYVHHEMGYDKFNANYDRIYRLEGDDYGKLPPIVGTYVKDKVPEIESITRLALGGNGFISYVPADHPEESKQIEVSAFYADSTTFGVFTMPFILGDPQSALTDPFTVVLTESAAKKLFGDINPMMKNIVVLDHQFRITGIIRDIKNSHIEVDVLYSQESIAKVYPDRDLNNLARNSWLWSATYLLMNDEIDDSQVEEKINNVLTEINDGNLFDIEFKHFHIRPLKDIYFSGAIQNLQYGLHGDLKSIQIYFVVAILILVIACINYINLTTARATLRTNEVAIKKIAGSSISLLRYQLITESIIISFIALIIALTLVQVFLSKFNRMTMINFNIAELNRPIVWALVISSVVAIGIVAGIYPAVYLTTVKTITLMKGHINKGSGGIIFRKTLMTFQFSITIILIIGIITSLRQLQYARTRDLGFKKEQIITINTPSNFPEQYSLRETFKERLIQNQDILKVAYSAGIPGVYVPTITYEIDGIKRTMGSFLIDQEYLGVMGIQISDGRNFSLDRIGDRRDETSNDIQGILLNEAAVREFGIDSPIGKIIQWNDLHSMRPLKIIGIIRDFHFKSLHHKIEPLCMGWVIPMQTANIKISSSNIPATLKIIEVEWKKVYGSKPFVYDFLDESFDRQYKSDERLATVIGYFTWLAIIIACMGLFALSSFMVSRRTKEIGIRKTLGATVKTIYAMLSWDFLKWIVLAAIIACPIGWYVMNKWLETFAYHITLGPDIFIIAILIAVSLALLTITWQALKTARANPVEALRYE